MTSGKNKHPRCEVEAIRDDENEKAGCDHRDRPLWMMALWGAYQARCLGCRTAGPVVDEGPWAAQQALYSSSCTHY
jgi:hypothetical protein